MARIRTIKPEFQNSQSMGRVSRDARLTFIELWPQCDDAGRIRANSRMLASILFPYDDDALNLMETWLSELEKEGCITRYSVGNDEFLQICHWDHQKIDHPAPSRLPAPTPKNRKKTKLSGREDSRGLVGNTTNLRAVSSTVSRTKDRTVPVSLSQPDGFEEFWLAFPRKVAKPKARKAYSAALARAPCQDILAGALRYARERQGEPDRYTAHPATWLGGERWNDQESSNERRKSPHDKFLDAAVSFARGVLATETGPSEASDDRGDAGEISGYLSPPGLHKCAS